MTRDEAITVQAGVYFPQGANPEMARKVAAAQIKAWVALGILKLDEPKSASEKAFDIICRDVGGIHADIILDKLRAAGLQIVGK